MFKVYFLENEALNEKIYNFILFTLARKISIDYSFLTPIFSQMKSRTKQFYSIFFFSYFFTRNHVASTSYVIKENNKNNVIKEIRLKTRKIFTQTT